MSKVQAIAWDRVGTTHKPVATVARRLAASTPHLQEEEASDLRGQLHYRVDSWSSHQLHGWGWGGSAREVQLCPRSSASRAAQQAWAPFQKQNYQLLRRRYLPQLLVSLASNCNPALQMRMVQVKLFKRACFYTLTKITQTMQALFVRFERNSILPKKL